MPSVGALYVHVPYCARKCAYCDFASVAASRDDPRLEAHAKAMAGMLRSAASVGLLGGCRTAYLGGGTPTLLGARRLGALVRQVRASCPRLDELTVEANPDSLGDDELAALAEAGATRLSVGVQSLCDDELAALGRLHTARQAEERVRAAVRTGLRVSVDLMCAIPQQTPASWRQTLQAAVGLGVGHVSVYPLSIEEGTPLARRVAGHEVPWNDPDVQAERMEEAERVLLAAGLRRYEVASYAKPGQQCAHNVAYWTGVPYLGLGRGAASMLEPAQYELVRTLMPWLPAPDPGATRLRVSTLDREVEQLDAREAWAEDLMLGMRLTRGVDASLLDAVPATRDALVARGLAALRHGRLVPTHDGWLLGNELYGALWDLADQAEPPVPR